MLIYNSVDQEADPYSIANTIALNALVARAKSKGELLAHAVIYQHLAYSSIGA